VNSVNVLEKLLTRQRGGAINRALGEKGFETVKNRISVRLSVQDATSGLRHGSTLTSPPAAGTGSDPGPICSVAAFPDTRSLSHFVRKTPENRRLGDFFPCKLRKQPDNRGFYGFLTKKAIKTYKCNRLLGKFGAWHPFWLESLLGNARH
jgi:hypothetical protein